MDGWGERARLHTRSLSCFRRVRHQQFGASACYATHFKTMLPSLSRVAALILDPPPLRHLPACSHRSPQLSISVSISLCLFFFFFLPPLFVTRSRVDDSEEGSVKSGTVAAAAEI